jgi:hypothetical protein
MTSSRLERHKFTALLVLAPVTAASLSVATSWALEHDPLSSTASATSAPPAPPAVPLALRALEARVASATRRFETTRLALLDVERRIHVTARQIAAAKESGRSTPSSAGSSGGAPVYVPPTQSASVAPAPPPAPPPPVSTTTGAS